MTQYSTTLPPFSIQFFAPGRGTKTIGRPRPGRKSRLSTTNPPGQSTPLSLLGHEPIAPGRWAKKTFAMWRNKFEA